jgi:hypothetical protein
LVEKPELKRPLRRPPPRVDNNEMDFGEMECGGVNWIGLV